jgi:hypothetical protein
MMSKIKVAAVRSEREGEVTLTLSECVSPEAMDSIIRILMDLEMDIDNPITWVSTMT